MNTSIDSPITNAEIDTHTFSGWKLDGYVTTRRGMPIMPSANSGPKVELNAMNSDQKWILPRRSLN